MAESARAQGKAPGDKGGQSGGEIRGKGKQRKQGGRERWEREGRRLMPTSLFAMCCVEWVPSILLQ